MASSCPWNENRLACVSLGNLEDVLTLAVQQGYTISGSVSQASRRHDSSLQLTAVLSELSDLHSQLDSVCSRIRILSEQQSTVDLTDTGKAGNWLDSVKNLSDHLCKLLNEKQYLISLLSEPLVGQHIQLDAKYHRLVADVFPQLVEFIASLPNHVASLRWSLDSLCCVDDDHLLIPAIATSTRIGKEGFPDLSKTTQAVSALQSHFRKLHASHRALAQLIESSHVAELSSVYPL